MTAFACRRLCAQAFFAGAFGAMLFIPLPQCPAQGQQIKRTAPIAAPGGYLSRSVPPNLRFSPPPKPPVASLPAAPVPVDTPLVIADKFLDKGDPGTTRMSDRPDAMDNFNHEGGPGGKLGNGRSGREPARPRQSESQLLQMLLKYFERPAAKLASTNQFSQFVPPVHEEITVVPLGATTTPPKEEAKEPESANEN